jgi:hypothetical protein
VRVAHGGGQQRGQRSGAGHERSDPLVAVRARGVRGERSDVRLHVGVHALAGRSDDRLVEEAEAHVASEIGQGRIAAFYRQHERLERLAEVVAHVPSQRVDLLQAPVEDRHDRRARRGGALLRDEQAVARLL